MTVKTKLSIMQLNISYKVIILTKKDKLLKRFLSKPKDLTWDEYAKVFAYFGFELKAGNGSRRSFVDGNNNVFHIHEPHPSSIMKPYTIKLAIEWLTEQGYIKDNDDE